MSNADDVASSPSDQPQHRRLELSLRARVADRLRATLYAAIRCTLLLFLTGPNAVLSRETGKMRLAS